MWDVIPNRDHFASDFIHDTPRHSIYDRNDYIVNSDMTIPYGMARTLVHGFQTEAGRRPGLPGLDFDSYRGPYPSPLVLHPPTYHPTGVRNLDYVGSLALLRINP
jgi:hypothetical protein